MLFLLESTADMPDITPSIIQHVASLAHIPLTPAEEKLFAQGFTTTMKVVDQLNSVDVQHIEPLHQVTGLWNVLRDDEVDASRMFTQEQVCMNAHQSHNGYIVVEQILDQK